jgi:alpha-ketoglutarate-dependent 2,4-dichlorophenoxyacetate dioxygenase
MPGLINQTSVEFKNFNVHKLHPTFGAQISGVDFCSPISDEVFNEILAAITKVGRILNNDRCHFD